MSGIDYGTTTMDSTMTLLLGVIWILSIILSLVYIISLWKIFKKAGKPGWASIVPIYNYVVMIQIAELPIWYIILFFIPVANIIALILVSIKMAQNFGKSATFGIGFAVIPIIFAPLLAFSDSTYKGEQKTDTVQQNNFDAMNVINGEQTENIDVVNASGIPTIENANIMVEGDNTVNETASIVDDNINESNNIETIDTNVEPEAPSIDTIEIETQVSEPTETIESIEIDSQVSNETQSSDTQNNVTNEFNMSAPIDTNNENVQVSEEVVEKPNAFNMSATIETTNNEENSTPQTEANKDIKICKSCGNEMPKIVSICPNCGTENE